MQARSLQMLVMCEQWGQRMGSLCLDTAPVFTSEHGWGHKVLSLSSLSGPCRASIRHSWQRSRNYSCVLSTHWLARTTAASTQALPHKSKEFQSLHKTQSSSPTLVFVPQGGAVCVEHHDFISLEAARGGDLTVSVSANREGWREISFN